MTISILILQIRMPIEYHQRTFSLQISHYWGYTKLRWYSDKHMYMIWTTFRLYYFNSFSVTQFSQYLAYIRSDISIYNFSSIFGGKPPVSLRSSVKKNWGWHASDAEIEDGICCSATIPWTISKVRISQYLFGQGSGRYSLVAGKILTVPVPAQSDHRLKAMRQADFP